MSMPSIKLIEPSRKYPGATGDYQVAGLVGTIKFNIGQWLKKEEVQQLIDAGTFKVTVNGK